MIPRPSTRPARGRLIAPVIWILACVLAVVGLAGCGGSDTKTPKKSVSERLASAKKTLDDSKAVTIDLKTPKLPQGTQGILSASGTGTKAPAFQGKISVIQSGLSVEVPVVAVDGKTYIQFAGRWQEIDPKKFGAPDPAQLFVAGGLSSILTEVTGAKAGKDTRDGKKILSTITGTIPGKSVKGIIPSAAADQDFDATFVLDDSDRLVSTKLRGPFYDSGDVTYTIDFSDYGKTVSISKP